MSDTLRSVRRSLGITAREFALRLGVTPSAVSQLEQSERVGTIKLRTLESALEALGKELVITTVGDGAYADLTPPVVAAEVSAALRSGETAFALRILTEAASRVARHYGEIDPAELEIAPPPLPDRRWDQLFRALYREAIPTADKPAWARPSRLEAPWFLSEYPVLRERAKTTTPDFLRRLNIFVDATSLQRA